MTFHMHPSGLHIHNPKGSVFCFVTTVDGNKVHFMKQQIEAAKKACTLYTILGFPSHQNFKWILQSNQIKDCPMTVQDVEVGYKIWGSDIAVLKAKRLKKTLTCGTGFT